MCGFFTSTPEAPPAFFADTCWVAELEGEIRSLTIYKTGHIDYAKRKGGDHNNVRFGFTKVPVKGWSTGKIHCRFMLCFWASWTITNPDSSGRILVDGVQYERTAESIQRAAIELEQRAVTLFGEGQHEEAGELFESLLAQLDPANDPTGHAAIILETGITAANTMSNVGGCLVCLGRHTEAVEVCEQALSLAAAAGDNASAKGISRTHLCEVNLANALLGAGERVKAAEHFLAVADLLPRIEYEEHGLADDLEGLGAKLIECEDASAAADVFGRAVLAAEDATAEDPQWGYTIGDCLKDLAVAREHMRDPAAAAVAYGRSASAYDAHYGEESEMGEKMRQARDACLDAVVQQSG